VKVLFLGGTGNLSLDCSRAALERGIELCHLNRGRKAQAPAGVETIVADLRDAQAAKAALGGREFDVVVDFIAYVPDHVRTDLELFEGRVGQFVFISTASAYRKPPAAAVITESTPLSNPFWDYSRDKIVCEDILWAAWKRRGFPLTVIRPSHTYSTGWLPLAFGSSDFTIAQRMLDGKPVIVHGDGSALWTLTHAKDFARGLAGLLGNPLAVGEAFNVVGDEALSWENIHLMTYAALGCAKPNIVHIPSDWIARIDPELGQHLLGDKTWSTLFDNSKIKRYVPDFRTTVPFHEGLRLSADWYLADPGRRKVNADMDERIERLLKAWKA
jgi:nucleoside-diphosphate-sugar epimerase